MVTDSLGASNPKQFSLTINAAPVVSTTSLPSTTSGLVYSQTLTNTGGTSPFTWNTTGLPSWLTLNGATLAGTAPSVSVPTPYAFSVTVTDTAGAASQPQALSVTVNPVLTITTGSTLGPWTATRPFSTTISATGGVSPYQFMDAGNTLPSWLTITTAGVLSGTPPSANTYTFTIKVTDSQGTSTAQSFSLLINPVPSVSTTSLPSTTSGATYSQTLTNTGGTSPFTWNTTGLPSWLTLNGATLSGTAPAVTSSTQYSFSVTVTDTAGAVSQPQALSVTV
ncbi:MAG TPA: putative Ig domain-containing protein, partial [Bryobacteraceae bacterium]|nr:putative Ig domain-containing protein [Bryobacteraceae bacterium]